MVKLIKGKSVKILSDNSSIIDVLKFEGWIVETEKTEAVVETVPVEKPLKKKKEDK